MSWRGKLSQVVQELRIHCCQYSPASTVTRYSIPASHRIQLTALSQPIWIHGFVYERSRRLYDAIGLDVATVAVVERCNVKSFEFRV